MKLLCIILACVIGIGCSSSAKTTQKDTLEGKWTFVGSTERSPGASPMGEMPELSFETATGKVTGSTGCNKIMGSYSTSGNGFSFGPLATTRKACPNMEVEKFFTGFLDNVGSYKFEQGRLLLYSKDDKAKYLVFARPKTK
jgi:heat shock protein HslJ